MLTLLMSFKEIKFPLSHKSHMEDAARHCKIKPIPLYWVVKSLSRQTPPELQGNVIWGISNSEIWECDCRFRWRRRLLIISSPSDEDWSFQQQLYSLNSQACNLGMIPTCFWYKSWYFTLKLFKIQLNLRYIASVTVKIVFRRFTETQIVAGITALLTGGNLAQDQWPSFGRVMEEGKGR